MEQSPSYKRKIQIQFQAYCYKILRGEAVDYYRYVNYLQKHEKSIENLSSEESDELYVSDEYRSDDHLFKVLEYDIGIKSDLLAEVLNLLSQKKRDVILLSFFVWFYLFSQYIFQFFYYYCFHPYNLIQFF